MLKELVAAATINQIHIIIENILNIVSENGFKLLDLFAESTSFYDLKSNLHYETPFGLLP